jgi:hypothetical protein
MGGGTRERPNIQNTKMCFGFFCTGCHSSDKRQYSGFLFMRCGSQFTHWLVISATAEIPYS